MPDHILTWTAKRWGWHVADSKALPRAVYHIMPCADGYQLHRLRDRKAYVWGTVFNTVIEAKQAAQTWEDRTAKNAPQPAAAGSVAP